MNTRQYDDLNQHDIQAILDNAAGVVREVEAGSTAYTPEEHQHAQDTQREVVRALKSPSAVIMTLPGSADVMSDTLIN